MKHAPIIKTTEEENICWFMCMSTSPQLFWHLSPVYHANNSWGNRSIYRPLNLAVFVLPGTGKTPIIKLSVDELLAGRKVVWKIGLGEVKQIRLYIVWEYEWLLWMLCACLSFWFIRSILRLVLHTVKPVCNDHLYNKNYYLWFIK